MYLDSVIYLDQFTQNHAFLPAMKDHLSWVTIQLSVGFIQIVFYVNVIKEIWLGFFGMKE